MKVTVEGRKRLVAKQRLAARSVESRVHRAVAWCGEDLLTVAMPGVPLAADPGGELRRSGYVDHLPGLARVGFSAPHAPYVHEMGEPGGVHEQAAPINWTTPGTGAKFLTGPFLENRQRYARHIIDEARKGLR